MKIGISACLLGQRVRYDGGHKLVQWLLAALGPEIEFVPVCPEAGCGLGVPREPMQLVGDPAQPRLITIETRRDVTAQLQAWIQEKLPELAHEGVGGFIFKCRSPSCGTHDVEVWPDTGGPPQKTGTGLFARAFTERFPHLPVTDEESLPDASQLRAFVNRVTIQ